MGYTGQIAQIHGGMDYTEREEQVERFRKSAARKAARDSRGTDAAGEGINLQFCWLMVNYDMPWNPARLEQRMGRIHRYGQKHDPVVILNLVAPRTREGRVLKTLLDKLETIRKELQSDKVFDVIGRLFEGVSITEYMEQALDEGAEAGLQTDGRPADQGTGRRRSRPAKRCSTAMAATSPANCRDCATTWSRRRYCRLLPGYVRHFIERAAPRLGLAIDGDPNTEFGLRAARSGALDPLLPVLETYPPAERDRLTVVRPADQHDGRIWVHPGEPVFEAFLAIVRNRLGDKALRGAVFVDPARRSLTCSISRSSPSCVMLIPS